jgi:hypothetical protein
MNHHGYLLSTCYNDPPISKTRCIGGWVAHKTGLGRWGKCRPSVILPHSNSLYRLPHLSPHKHQIANTKQTEQRVFMTRFSAWWAQKLHTCCEHGRQLLGSTSNGQLSMARMSNNPSKNIYPVSSTFIASVTVDVFETENAWWYIPSVCPLTSLHIATSTFRSMRTGTNWNQVHCHFPLQKPNTKRSLRQQTRGWRNILIYAIFSVMWNEKHSLGHHLL